MTLCIAAGGKVIALVASSFTLELVTFRRPYRMVGTLGGDS
ncbi:hypothetical protein FALB51S_03997 [Frigidibacter albus]